jgi:hypothetical protein
MSSVVLENIINSHQSYVSFEPYLPSEISILIHQFASYDIKKDITSHYDNMKMVLDELKRNTLDLFNFVNKNDYYITFYDDDDNEWFCENLHKYYQIDYDNKDEARWKSLMYKSLNKEAIIYNTLRKLGIKYNTGYRFLMKQIHIKVQKYNSKLEDVSFIHCIKCSHSHIAFWAWC